MNISQKTISIREQWLAVFSLAAGSFSLVTAELFPVGLLAAIAAELGISVGRAGLLVAVPAIVAAVSAPCLAIFAARRDRRNILLLLSVLLVVSNLLATYAPTWTWVLAARSVFGVAVGGFWAIGASLPQRIMAPKAFGRATSMIYAGVSLGIVLGVPAATLIGQRAGWRCAFAVASAMALLALALQWFALPRVAGGDKLGAREMVRLAARPSTMIALGVTVLAVGTQFATYTFFEPFLRDVARFDASFVAVALLAYGSAGILGSLLGGIGVDRSLACTLSAVLAATAAALSGLFFFGQTVIVVLPIIIVWGIAFGALPLCLQLWNARLAHPQVEAGAALFVALLQASIAIGAALGGVVVDQFGVRANVGIGACLFALAFTVAWLARESLNHTPTTP